MNREKTMAGLNRTGASMDDGDRSVAAKGKRAKWASLVVLLAIVAALPAVIGGSYFLHVLILVFIYIVAAASFRTIAISGQFSIAHAGFMGIGAYVAGMSSRWLGWSPWITIPLGGIAALAVGLILAYPFSRLRAMYYAMGTLFFGVVIVNAIQAGGIWTGGPSGLSGIKPLFVGSRTVSYYFCMAFMVVSLAALYRFEHSRIGLTWKAIAQDHLVATSVGISESGYRVLAVAVGCFFAGCAGATFAHYNMAIALGSFGLSATLWIIMYVLIGGINNFWGPIIGTALLILVPEFFRGLKAYSPYLSAGILLVIVYTMPDGLVGLPKAIQGWILRRRGRKGAAGDAS
jgi:branched-chain amino acid transport system permease protein